MTYSTWKKATLADTCDIVKGSTAIQRARPGPYPLVTTGEQHKTADHFQFDGEAVCVPLISSTGHGHASLKRVHYHSGKFALANLLAALIVRDPSRLSARFLALYLNYFKDRLIVPLMVGAANMSLTVKRLATVRIAYPVLDEQQRIVGLLDAAEELRRLREQADQRTAAIVPALFHEMFGDPASNSKGWESVTCNRLLADPLRNGISPSKQGSFSANVLTLSAITGSSFTPTAWKEALFASTLDETQWVKPSIFLICRGNGNLNLVGTGKYPSCTMIGTCFPDTMIAARWDEDLINPIFMEVVWATPFVRQQIESSARTTNGTYKINQGAVEQIEVPLPPLELQRTFAARVAAVRAMEAKQAESRRRLDDLFQSLLHRAFRGEL